MLRLSVADSLLADALADSLLADALADSLLADALAARVAHSSRKVVGTAVALVTSAREDSTKRNIVGR